MLCVRSGESAECRMTADLLHRLRGYLVTLRPDDKPSAWRSPSQRAANQFRCWQGWLRYLGSSVDLNAEALKIDPSYYAGIWDSSEGDYFEAYLPSMDKADLLWERLLGIFRDECGRIAPEVVRPCAA